MAILLPQWKKYANCKLRGSSWPLNLVMETDALCVFSTFDHRITIFSPKYLTKITLYQTMQNYCKCIKYSLLNSRNRKWLRSLVTSPA